MENKMFACFPCSFSTDVAGDFVKHLSEKHKDQVNDQEVTNLDETTEILTDPIYKCPYCNFLHHELAQVQSHITERHEWSPGVTGSKSDDGRMNLINLVDEPTQEQDLISQDVLNSQVEKNTSQLCGNNGRKSTNSTTDIGSKAWASRALKQESEDLEYTEELEPIIQIRVENEAQKQACATIIMGSNKKLVSKNKATKNPSQKLKETPDPRVLSIKRARRMPKRLADQISDGNENDEDKDVIASSSVSKKRNPKRITWPDLSKLGRRRRGNGTHPCSQCFKTFKNKCDLDRHVSNIHLKLKPYSCDRCSRSFGLRGNLKKHIDIVHFNKKRVNAKVTCPVCSNVYSSNHSLTLHVASVHSQEKRFQCEKCGMKFGWSGCYERHIRSVHLQEKNYKCDICGTAFARKEHLRAHSKRHAPKEDSITKDDEDS